jgi:aspartokinase/homoserine dehydrogenase 1
VRRKVVVLARELGLEMGFDSVEVDSLMPEALKSWQPDTGSSKSVAEQLVEALKPHDDEMREYLAAKIAKSGAGSVPVQISRVNVEAGSARVTLEGASDADRVSRLKPNENIIEISSRRYSASPMVLQGPGAGAEITASGLFADLLHLSRTLVE